METGPTSRKSRWRAHFSRNGRREGEAGSSTPPPVADSSGADHGSTSQMTESNDGPPNECPSRAARSCLRPSDDEGDADATSVEEPLSVFSLRSLAQIKEGEDP